MATDADRGPQRKKISLEEIRERAENQKFSEDPEVEALRDTKLSELRAIAADEEHPQYEAAKRGSSELSVGAPAVRGSWR